MTGPSIFLGRFDNSRSWVRKLRSLADKNGSGPCPMMGTDLACRSARGSRRARLVPCCAHHAHSCSPTKAWNISTHRAASATGPAPSAQLPGMKAADCASLSRSLSVKNTIRIGRVTVASYFGISEVYLQQATILAFGCLVSMGLTASSNLSPRHASSPSIHLPSKASIFFITHRTR